MSTLSLGQGSNSPSGVDLGKLHISSKARKAAKGKDGAMDLTGDTDVSSDEEPGQERGEGQPLKGTPPSHNGGGTKRKHDDGQEGRHVRQRLEGVPLSNEAMLIAQAKEIECLKEEKRQREQELKQIKQERQQEMDTICNLCERAVEQHQHVVECTQMELPEDKRPDPATLLTHRVHKRCAFKWNQTVVALEKRCYTCPKCNAPKVGGGFLQIDRKTDPVSSEITLEILRELGGGEIPEEFNENNIHYMEPVEVDQARYDKSLAVTDFGFERRKVFEEAKKKMETARKSHGTALAAVEAAVSEIAHLNYAERLKDDELAFRAANPPPPPPAAGRGAARGGARAGRA
jgi:hypothetical protein